MTLGRNSNNLFNKKGKIMNLFFKNRGMVSIFLVIILVPVITVTSLFVDASRMFLAKPVITSSGDLALNSMMSKYDVDLNDYYGLLASSQSISEFKKNVCGYFEDSMKSQNISKTYVQNTLVKIQKLLGTKDPEKNYSDLLKINVNEKTLNIAPLNNSGLNNPAVMKTQIVNFMKYRAPIDGAALLWEKFKKMGKESSGKVEESALVSDKQDAAESEGSLMESLNNLYKKCVTDSDSYTNNWKGLAKGIKREDVSDPKEIVNLLLKQEEDIKKDYQKIHEKLVTSLYLRKEIKEDANVSQVWFTPSLPQYGTPSQYNNNNKADEESFKQIIGDFYSGFYQEKDADQKVKKDQEEFDDTERTDEIQRTIQYAKIIRDDYIQYKKDVKQQYTAYEKIKNAYRFLDFDSSKQCDEDIEYTDKNGTKQKRSSKGKTYSQLYSDVKSVIGNDLFHKMSDDKNKEKYRIRGGFGGTIDRLITMKK
jgi:hypothetical protein